MNEDQINQLKKDIVAIGRLLWEKELVTGLNGNISVRVDNQRLLLTATQTCLGLLQATDVLLVDCNGEVLEAEGRVSTERLLHAEVYKNFPEIKAVIHTHTTYANAYFLERDQLSPRIFESKFYLGDVVAIEQKTPAVTDPGPIMKALQVNSIVALKNHGLVSMGKNLFDCFLLIQCLEDSVKIDAISKLYRVSNNQENGQENRQAAADGSGNGKKYKLFSDEQIEEIVRLVNSDTQLQDLGAKTQMNMDLAVQLNETGQVHSFCFENGRITKVGDDQNSEFLISAPENIWRAVFNQEIDPFVATTQKKMDLRGDFAKISKWYAPCSRIFELWRKVPVE